MCLVSQPARILYIEDYPDVQRVMRIMFRMRGYVAHISGTCKESLEVLQRNEFKPDIALIDLMLPDGDGCDVLQFIRDNQMPIRTGVLTASTPERAMRALSLSPDFVLYKPFDFVRLVDLIDKFVSKARP